MITVVIAALMVATGLIMFALGQWSGEEKQKTKKPKPQPKWGRDDK